jgi:hypothetical protein
MDADELDQEGPLTNLDEAWHRVPDRYDDAPTRSRLGKGKTMVVVRESNMFDLLAFATMIRQVLEMLVGVVPGAEEVLSRTGDKAQIMRNDSVGIALRQEWGARALYQDGRPYGWIFEVQGTLFLFAMSSAFSDATEDLGNSFTDDLISELRLHRPAALVTGPSTRLVRRKDLGERLGHQAHLLKVRIFTKETPDGLDMSSATGSTQWTLLCLLAEQDLRYTITRLLSGRIFHVGNGGWLAGAGKLPYGFVLDGPETKRPVVGDTDQVALARALLSLAHQAAQELPLPEEQRSLWPEDIVRRLSHAGAKKRTSRKAAEGGTAVAGADLETVDDARTTLIGLLSVLPAYGPDGKLRRMQGLPITGLSAHDVHGHTIFKRDPANPEEKGAIRFEWTFPKPVGQNGEEEPWATDEVLAGSTRYLEHLRSTAGSGHSTEKVWPLTGLFEAEHQGASYRFLHASGGYQWKQDGVAVGKFDPVLATRGLVDSIIAELGRLHVDPGKVRLPTPPAAPVGPSPKLAELQAQHKACSDKFENALAAVRDTTSTRQQAVHQRAADNHEKELAALDQQIEALAALPVPGAGPSAERVVVGDLATLLSVVRDTAGQPLPPGVCSLLGRYVTRGTIEGCWDDASPWGLFRATVAVPREDGFGREVEVSFELGNTSQGPDRKAFGRRMARVLEMRMTTAVTIEELAHRLGAQPTARRVARNLQDALGPLFRGKGLSPEAASAAATAAVDCPIDSTRAVIWALLNDIPVPEAIEHLDATETALHVADLHEKWLSADFPWRSAAWSAGGERQRRRMGLWAQANSGTGPLAGAPLAGLLEAFKLRSVQSINSMLWSPKEPLDGTARTLDGKARTLERTVPWPSGAFMDPSTGRRQVSVPDDQKRVRLRACPNCGHQGLHPVVCVDLGDDPVLCPECHRQPNGLKRPHSYLLDWEGPFGRTRFDERGATDGGARRGTVLGGPPEIPVATGGLRRKPAAPKRRRVPLPPRPCRWPGCGRPVPLRPGKGRPPSYCGEDGHNSRAGRGADRNGAAQGRGAGPG